MTSRVIDLFLDSSFQPLTSSTVYEKVDDRWVGHSMEDITAAAIGLSVWMLDKGYRRGDRICVIPRMANRRWIIIDLAAQMLGIILVPMHPTSSEKEMSYVLNQTRVKLCITADAGLYYKVRSLDLNGNFLEYVRHLQSEAEGFFRPIRINTYDEDRLPEIENLRNQLLPEDLVVIMYTSGSEGNPKGVMLKHSNIVSNLTAAYKLFPLKKGQRVMSFLPFSHIFERAAVYMYLKSGGDIYLTHSRSGLRRNFKEVQPHFFTAVPRILEKMYEAFQNNRAQRNLVVRTVIDWALKQGESPVEGSRSVVTKIKLQLARTLILGRLKNNLGGKVQNVFVGAAHLRENLETLFYNIGINLVTGYGLTETSPIVSMSSIEKNLRQKGTVGKPIPGVEVKISEADGEILVRGDNVMHGYFMQQEKTAETINEDGWLKTGDIGHFNDSGYLVIRDRKKNVFKTSSGKYIAPSPIEQSILESKYINQALVIGFKRPFVIAVLVPNFIHIKEWCRMHKVHWSSPEYMVHNIKVQGLLQQEIDIVNDRLPNFKRVRKFHLDPEEWTEDNGMLTSTFKQIRTSIIEKHGKFVDKLYE